MQKQQFSDRGGEESKKFQHCRGRGLKNFRTGVGLPIWGDTFAGGSVPHYMQCNNVTYSFPRMLMSHKNFHFTQISSKNNDVVFFKSLKTMFLDHF